MQSKTFTIPLDSNIPESTLNSAGIDFSLYGTEVHKDLDISVSGAGLLSEQPILATPSTIKLANITSHTLVIRISHPTDLNINDLQLSYITNSFLEYNISTSTSMKDDYEAFHNFYNGDGNIWNDINYTSSFTTEKFGFSYDSSIDMKLQFSYDGSVNVIFTDDENPVRLVNSRFKVSEDGLTAELADRNQLKDTNTYSEDYFHRTELIPSFTNVARLTFDGLTEGGILKGGGYRYFFRYITADGSETNIIEESRLVEIHRGDSVLKSIGDKVNENTNRVVNFTLTNLDRSFYGVSVYYTQAVGDFGAVSAAYKISSPFLIEDGVCKIIHTGYEPIESVSKDELNVNYSPISQGKTLSIAENRLLIGNSELDNLFSNEWASLASSIKITEGTFDVKHPKSIYDDGDENYANSSFTYDKLGYWKGETYELGVVFTSEDKVSSVYPLHGIDNYNGDNVDNYNENLTGNTTRKFFTNGQNSLGVYRTSNSMQDFWTESNGDIVFRGTNLKIDVTPLLGYPEGTEFEIAPGLEGLVIVHIPTIIGGEGTYYLNGVINESISGGTTTGTLTGITIPTSDVVWSFTNADTTTGSIKITGTTGDFVVVNSTVVGTDLTPQTGIPQPETDYNGFFFVRRIRKKDKLAQGIITPVAAIPTSGQFQPDALTAIPGNWTGIGVKSEEHGENVTFVPAPNCITPWGIEQVSLPKDFDPANEEILKSVTTDFLVRAPILDYADQKSWAFYTPDIDCNPTEAAGMFHNIRMGISIRQERISTEYVFEENPPAYNWKLPVTMTLSGTYGDDNAMTWKFPTEAVYTEEGSLAPSVRSFSSKIDRNVNLFLNDGLESSLNLNTIDLAHFAFVGDANNPFVGTDIDATSTTEEVAAAFYPVTVGVIYDEGGTTIKNDSDSIEERTPGVAINYGRYVGINIPNYLYGLDGLNKDSRPDPALADYPLANVDYECSLDIGYHSYVTSGSYTRATFTDDPNKSYGYYADLYDNVSGTHIGRASWESRYLGDESSKYISISPRYDLNDFSTSQGSTFNVEVELYGGDCYLGQQWKQVWSPLGIEEAPQINDPEPYKVDRRSLGLLNYGFAIPIPVQSNYNFNIRSRERRDEVEYRAFRRDRSFLPVKRTIRGDRLLETSAFNFGYDTTYGSDVSYFRLSSHTPFIRLSYPNRVYASNPAVENEFWNGFTVFYGLNFKDYNSEFGSITRIITVNNYTYLVYSHGISQIGVNERSMVSTDTGGIFADSYEVLSSKANVVSDDFGSQHIHSIVGSIYFLYGVDVINKKVWRANQKGFLIISDFKVQKLLTEIVDEMTDYVEANGGGLFDVYSSFDSIKNEIYFTFSYRQEDDIQAMYSRTIVFNETLSAWITETDDTRKFIFKIKEERYSFPINYDTVYGGVSDLSTIYKYYRTDNNSLNTYYNKFYGYSYDTELEYTFLKDPNTAKILQNIFVVGNNTIPYSVAYTIDNLTNTKIQTLTPSTNVAYTIPTETITGIAGNDYFEATPGAGIIKWNGEQLGWGDFISATDDLGTIHYFMCTGYVIGVTTKIYVDRFLTSAFTNKSLTYGYRNPIRLADAIYEDDYTKLICRIREPKTSSKLFAPRGKWSKIKLTYQGMYPVYINNIISGYSVSHS